MSCSRKAGSAFLHPVSSQRRFESLPSTAVDAEVARYFFATGCLLCVFATTVVALFYEGMGPVQRQATVIAGLGGSVVFALAGVLARGRLLPWCMAAALLAAMGVLMAAAITTGQGVHTPSLGMMGLFVVLAGLLLGLRVATGLAGVGLVAILVLAQLERSGVLPGLASSVAHSWRNRVITQSVVLCCGLGFAWALQAVARRTLRQATEQQGRFRALLGLAADGYWEQDEQCRFTFLSDAFARLGGLSPHGFLGRRCWEVAGLAVDDAAVWVDHQADLAARRPFRELVISARAPGGRVLWLSLSGEPVFEERGVFRGYWGVLQDITAQREAARALAASESRYRNLFARSPLALLIHRQGRIVTVNDAAARLFGFASPAEMADLALFSLYHPDSLELARERLALLDSLPPGESLPLADLVVMRRDGRPVDVAATASRVDGPDGPAVESIFLDNTSRREAETALLRSEAMLSRLFSSSPDVITVTDPATGRYVMVNPGFTRVTGYTAEEAVGHTVLELGLLSSQRQRERFLAEIREKGSVQDMLMAYAAKDGHTVWVLLSGAMFEVEGARYLLVLARDVTERERSRAEYKAILDNASVGIALAQHGRFLQANRRFEAMLGWPQGSLPGRRVREIWPSDDEFERVASLTREVLARGEQADFEWQMYRRDGSRFWARSRARLVEDADGGRGPTIWIVEDITEQRRVASDLAAAKEQAEAASQAKSAFLANMSHEIRTPLHGVLGLAQLALAPGVDSARREDYLRRIVDSAQTLAAIITDILDLSKIEAGRVHLEQVAFDLPALLRTLHSSYVELAHERGLELELRLADGLPHCVTGDPVRVQQILGNFVGNAVKFTEQGRVKIDARPLPAGGVRLSVLDSGPGIDPQTQERLFQPFTQADESISRRFGGTGLGLSICRQLAQLMGGRVGVDSRPGEGSRFWVELPLAAADDRQLQAEAPPPLPGSLAGSRVLVVEDNPVNMLIAVAMLEQWGVQVTQAAHGQEALDCVAAEGGRFDAVLMDVHMPGMSGFEATQALRQHHDAQALPIIALTAAALVSEQERTRAVGMNDFVAKPIDQRRLHATLQRWIRGEGGTG
ncbi:PAS domain-containing hybrid sensor histidine kinase/response regulator [Eleftheria terrae]|uniref:PAS domain-containing hybrid sensor histidine kinase/response regulator n=1 Tax=Eleftheria terrae TaxID=1597781 RepID=UPI00263AD8E9|nr:PAS domain S-box protein [Eleftheria terrae]WKB51165.1 PAS domain S-box protein [Eleftheria terrae]